MALPRSRLADYRDSDTGESKSDSLTESRGRGTESLLLGLGRPSRVAGGELPPLRFHWQARPGFRAAPPRLCIPPLGMARSNLKRDPHRP